MTRQELLDALVAERFGLPVPEWRPPTRHAPIAQQLEDLFLEQRVPLLDVIEGEAS